MLSLEAIVAIVVIDLVFLVSEALVVNVTFTFDLPFATMSESMRDPKRPWDPMCSLYTG